MNYTFTLESLFSFLEEFCGCCFDDQGRLSIKAILDGMVEDGLINGAHDG
jgi:hypothetical protein